MKKSLLLTLAVFLTLSLYSQIEKGDFVFSVNGNYMKTSTGNGVTTNGNYSWEKSLTIESSIEYLLTNKFCIGIGLDYNWGKITRYNALLVNNYYQAEEMNSKSKAFLPALYFGYYLRISNRLYLSPKLKFSYGKIKTDSKSYIIGVSEWVNGSGYNNPSRVLENNFDFELFTAGIEPELLYFFSGRFGLSLGLGGIEYSMIDWKNDNSSWVVNFNPSFWKLGIKVRI